MRSALEPFRKKPPAVGDGALAGLHAASGERGVPCIEYHIPKAREAGLSDTEISEAIGLSDTVRQVSARKVLMSRFSNGGQEPSE